MTFKKLLLPAVTLFALGCSSYRPILDENPHYEKVGPVRAERDIDECLTKADRYLESHKSERLKKEAGRGAVGGAILGGIVGALTGDANKALGGAAIGAGVGAASSAGDQLAEDKLKPDQIKQRYVSNCLKRKNYSIIGWK